MSDIDYRRLLIRYMAYIVQQEGVTYLEYVTAPILDANDTAALKAIEEEAVKLAIENRGERR